MGKSIEARLKEILNTKGDFNPEDDNFRKELRSILSKENLIPKNQNITSLSEWLRTFKKDPDHTKSIKFKTKGTSKSNKIANENLDYPGQVSRDDLNKLRRNKKTKAFIESLDDLGYDEDLIAKYMYEVDQDLRNILKKNRELNKTLPKDQRVSFGHLNPKSRSINSPRNVFVQLLSENTQWGDNYSLNPSGQLAIGNPSKEGLSWTDNWKRDFLIWADKVENGGTGILPQRGTYSELLEQKFTHLSGLNYNELSAEDIIKSNNEIDDLINLAERKNPFTPSQQNLRNQWGDLSDWDYEQATQLNSVFKKDRKLSKFYPDDTSDANLGKRLGGLDSTITVKDSGIRQFVNRLRSSNTAFADVDILRKLAGGAIGIASLKGLLSRPDLLDVITKEQGENLARSINKLKGGENAMTVLKEEGLNATLDLGKELVGQIPSLIGLTVAASTTPALIKGLTNPYVASTLIGAGAIGGISSFIEGYEGQRIIDKTKESLKLNKDKSDIISFKNLIQNQSNKPKSFTRSPSDPINDLAFKAAHNGQDDNNENTWEKFTYEF